MKKIIRYLVVLLCFISLSGCTTTSSNNIKVMYDGPNKEENVLLGVKNSVNQVNNFKFNGNILVDNTNYEIEGKAILKDNIASSIIFIKMNNIEIYLKDKHVYIGYMYGNTNIILKDDLDIFLEELALILNSKGIKCEIDKVRDFVYNKGISDLDFSKFNYLGKQEGKYIVGDSLFKLELNSKYLPSKFNFNKDKIKMNFDIDYSKTSINIPVGYDIFPLSIGQVKNLLRVDSLADLF